MLHQHSTVDVHSCPPCWLVASRRPPACMTGSRALMPTKEELHKVSNKLNKLFQAVSSCTRFSSWPNWSRFGRLKTSYGKYGHLILKKVPFFFCFFLSLFGTSRFWYMGQRLAEQNCDLPSFKLFLFISDRYFFFLSSSLCTFPGTLKSFFI